MKRILVYALLLVQWIACSKNSSPPPPPPPPPVKPAITSFTPSSGEEGTLVTISGSNLNIVTGVVFNGTSASFHLDGNKIQTDVPTGAKSGAITVKSPNGDAVSTNSFTVIPKLPSPVIDSIWPVDNPVTWEVQIFGKNFDSVVKVTFGGVDATIDENADGEIWTSVPSSLSAGTVNLILVNTRGGADTIPFNILSSPPYGQPSPDKAVATKNKAKYISRVTDNWFNAADPSHNYSMHLDSVDAHHGTGTEYINSDAYDLTFTYDLTQMTIQITVNRNGVSVIYTGEFVEPDPGTEKIVVYTEEHRQLVFVVKI